MKTLEVGSVKNMEYALLTGDGREYPAELSASVIKDPSGNPVSLIAIIKDITERKTAEDALKKSAHDLNERVKELDCLYAVSKLLVKPDITMNEVFQQTVEFMVLSWQYPEMICIRMIYES